MTRPLPLALPLCAAAVLVTSACSKGAAPITTVRPGATEMTRFESKADLQAFLASLAKRQRDRYQGKSSPSTSGVDEAEPPSPAAQESDSDSAGGESITNNQEAGVDEGGIVKAHGDFLIVLRRGRLFSVRVADKRVAPVSIVDVTPPGGGHDAWYDEMLVSGNRIVVVGYSYQASATELGLFDIDSSGRISYRSTHFLRSNDYYSSRNYASRLLGDKLVFYMPYSLASYGWNGEEPSLELPGVRPMGSGHSEWNTIVSATEIYQPIQRTESPVLHTVVTCDLAAPELSCDARGIVGPYGRNFYVSKNAVYVWVQGGWNGDPEASLDQNQGVVYRLPLDNSAPGAMRVVGAPIDQFSFKEDNNGHLNVLVRAQGGGDSMWSPEATAGQVALLRVQVAGFSTRVGTARRTAYTRLPTPIKGWSMQNRFVGSQVLYGTGTSWGYAEEDRDDRVFMHDVATGRTAILPLDHGVDRIEAMGKGAVVIGTDGKDLHFSSIDLKSARQIDRYTQPNASQGELRSHGFFYKPSSADGGVLGLPVRSQGRPGYEHLMHGSAHILFLGADRLRFRQLGALEASPEVPDDQCKVSCVDWYGNARPIFYRGRIFALLGYELVEGQVREDRMREVSRTSFWDRSRLQIAN